MKKRSDYRIIKYQFDERPDYFIYEVEQRCLWFFWRKPDADNILAHIVWYDEDYTRATDFHSIEEAEAAISRAINRKEKSSKRWVVG